MDRIDAPDFDLEPTLNSGQVFHWEKVREGFFGTIGDRAFYVEQQGATLRVIMAGVALRRRRDKGGFMSDSNPVSQELAPPSAAKIVRNYFALDHPLNEICASFPRGPVMNAACDFCQGLRIIRQPRWECLATFICSSMKQVAHIRQISRALRERFGEQRRIGDRYVYTFPSVRGLVQASQKELFECKLGYRAKNPRATAHLV